MDAKGKAETYQPKGKTTYACVEHIFDKDVLRIFGPNESVFEESKAELHEKDKGCGDHDEQLVESLLCGRDSHFIVNCFHL